jgi:hypothetical protein
MRAIFEIRLTQILAVWSTLSAISQLVEVLTKTVISKFGENGPYNRSRIRNWHIADNSVY